MPLTEERIPAEHRDLFGVRTDTPFTDGERRYSAAVQSALEDLLQGKRKEIVLLRRYHCQPERIAVFPAPNSIKRGELRLAMVERILISTLTFLRDVSAGGPVLQRESPTELLESQYFPTKHPHIIIERLDGFDLKDRTPLFTEWRLRRTQNQRAETQINRWLDVANLGVSVLKAFRGEK